MDPEPPNAVAQAAPAPLGGRLPAHPGFIAFFGASYKDVIKAARYMGATLAQADEATAKAMEEVMRRWGQIKDPVAYANARRSATSSRTRPVALTGCGAGWRSGERTRTSRAKIPTSRSGRSANGSCRYRGRYRPAKPP